MKRIILMSLLLYTSNIIKRIDPDLPGKSVAFISTASNTEKLKFLIILEKLKLKRMGLSVDEIDISKENFNVAKYKIEKSDYIYVSGGNTFFLLQELKKAISIKL